MNPFAGRRLSIRRCRPANPFSPAFSQKAAGISKGRGPFEPLGPDRSERAQPSEWYSAQVHFLNFLPLPHGQGSFGPIFLPFFTGRLTSV